MGKKRYCSDCGKPLGATVEKCFECGGEDPRLSREERLASSVWWKIELGVRPKYIAKAHGFEEDDD